MNNGILISKKVAIVCSLLILLVAAFFYLQPGQNEPPLKVSSTLEKIRQTKTIEACYLVWPPTVIKDPKTGELSGYLIDIMDQISTEIGSKVNYHEVTAQNFILMLNNGGCDVSVIAIYSTIPRVFNIAVTDPVFYTGSGALVAKSFAQQHSDAVLVSDLNAIENLRVVVQLGSVEEAFAKRNLPKAKISSFDTSDVALIFTEVSNGNADIAFADSYSVQKFTDNQPDLVDLFKNNPYNVTPASLGVRQNDVELLNFLNASLRYLRANGTLSELDRKYGSSWFNPRL